jgi:hypothetical protein
MFKRSCLIGIECSSLHSFYFVLNSYGMGLYTPIASSGYASDLVGVCKCKVHKSKGRTLFVVYV